MVAVRCWPPAGNGCRPCKQETPLSAIREKAPREEALNGTAEFPPPSLPPFPCGSSIPPSPVRPWTGTELEENTLMTPEVFSSPRRRRTQKAGRSLGGDCCRARISHGIFLRARKNLPPIGKIARSISKGDKMKRVYFIRVILLKGKL